MNVLDLFSGIGGFSLGLESTGFFKTISLNISQSLLHLFLAVNFFIFTIWYNFWALFVLRLLCGIFSTLSYFSINNSLKTFLNKSNKHTFGLLLIEFSWILSSSTYLIEGIIINQINGFNIFWYILGGFNILLCIISCMLPSDSIKNVNLHNIEQQILAQNRNKGL